MSVNSLELNLRQLSAFMTYRDYLFRLHRTYGLQGRDIRLLILIALAVDMNYGNEVQEKQVRELALKHHQIRTNVLNRLVSAGMITRRRDGVPYKISVTPQGWRIIETFLKRANYYINEISKKDRDKCAKLSYLLNID